MRKLDPNKLNTNRKKIGGKWKPAIMLLLYEKEERFNKIKQLMPGVSGNMLTQALKELVEDKILYKTETTKYGLTPIGKKITSLIIEIRVLVESL